MAYITLSNLRPAGADLLLDQESFFNDLSDRELAATVGGVTPVVTFTAASLGTVSVWGTSFGTGFAIGTFVAGAGAGAYAVSR